MEKVDAKELLRSASLRATAPRVTLVRLLSDSSRPLSYSEVVDQVGDDFDPTTMYRNLVTLKNAGLARVVSKANGMARYELVTSESSSGHEHPHFACDDCGNVTCLPVETVAMVSVSGPWIGALKAATVQLQGSCPDCLETKVPAPR